MALLSHRRPTSGVAGGGQPRRGHDRHGRIGGGGLRPAPHPARPIGVPPGGPRSSGDCSVSHRTTVRSGARLKVSDSTFVSMR